jgi:hypothetical protein
VADAACNAETEALKIENRRSWAAEIMHQLRNSYDDSPEGVIRFFLEDLMDLDDNHPERIGDADVEEIIVCLEALMGRSE